MANTKVVEKSEEATRPKGSGEPLGEPGKTLLAKLARDVPSERKAAELLQISDRTYCRALAGLGLRRGTRLLIELRLRELRVGVERSPGPR